MPVRAITRVGRGAVYDRGAHLRKPVGDEGFFAILRDWPTPGRPGLGARSLAGPASWPAIVAAHH